eukprot:TRINITY_DN67669_c12_g1_i1.p1 TRINITY_DN67669_c12_g1~~TRINITY_DN67669_c12_g1_i1.p1  ORF type:complete len:342 (+),score=43.50 TRINITY_DN67669_c12_g1_i1:65-1027(+)
MSTCTGCGEALGTGGHMEAQGKKYHTKCFTCSHCSNAISGSYLIVGDKVYEPECWETIRPRTYCHGCEKEVPAGEQYIEAMEKTWHHGCFTCVLCDKAFDEYKYWTYAPDKSLKEQPIHDPCRPKAEESTYGDEFARLPPSWKEYYDKKKADDEAKKQAETEDEDAKKKAEEDAQKAKEAAEKEAAEKAANEAKEEPPATEPESKDKNYPPCFACTKPIKETSMRLYGDNKYHFECFVCTTCKKELEGNGPFPMLEKALYHHDCYPWKTCSNCDKKIEGPVLSAMGKHFHKECFVCAKCEKPFTGAFTVKDDKMIHSECA